MYKILYIYFIFDILIPHVTKSPPPVNHKLLKRSREKGTGKLHANGELQVNSRVDIRIHLFISIGFQHRIMRNIWRKKEEIHLGYYFIQGGTKAKTIRSTCMST
jgi:hypothetical protein